MIFQPSPHPSHLALPTSCILSDLNLALPITLSIPTNAATSTSTVVSTDVRLLPSSARRNKLLMRCLLTRSASCVYKKWVAFHLIFPLLVSFLVLVGRFFIMRWLLTHLASYVYKKWVAFYLIFPFLVSFLVTVSLFSPQFKPLLSPVLSTT